LPENVINEINEIGDINEYKGQLYYWIPNLTDYYTPCNWDSVLDDAQFEAEAKLYSLSSIQNDYSLSGLVSYPKNITDKGEINEIKEELQKDKGAANAGGIRVVGAMPTESINNWKWFTPMSRNNIDGLHTNQIERSKFNIYAAFRQPPILNGVATGGMFNQESFADAFHYYNLTGRQMQGVSRIIRQFGKGDLTYKQAAILLQDGFGFNDEQIEIWLTKDEEF
jgi:hypothetical protein